MKYLALDGSAEILAVDHYRVGASASPFNTPANTEEQAA
jgi:hypothetical protein